MTPHNVQKQKREDLMVFYKYVLDMGQPENTG